MLNCQCLVTLNFDRVSVFSYEIFTVIVFMLAPLDEILQLLSLFLLLQVCVALKSTGKAADDLKDGSHSFMERTEQMGDDECSSVMQVTVSRTLYVLC